MPRFYLKQEELALFSSVCRYKRVLFKQPAFKYFFYGSAILCKETTMKINLRILHFCSLLFIPTMQKGSLCTFKNAYEQRHPVTPKLWVSMA